MVLQRLAGARVGFFLVNWEGVVVFAPNDTEGGQGEPGAREPGRYVSRCKVPGALLNSGTYAVTASSDIPWVEQLFYEESAIQFHVERIAGEYSARPDRLPGVICPELEWQVFSLEGTLSRP